MYVNTQDKYLKVGEMNPNPSACYSVSFYTQKCLSLDGGKHHLCACAQDPETPNLPVLPERLCLAGFLRALLAGGFLCKICIPCWTIKVWGTKAPGSSDVQQPGQVHPSLPTQASHSHPGGTQLSVCCSGATGHSPGTKVDLPPV